MTASRPGRGYTCPRAPGAHLSPVRRTADLEPLCSAIASSDDKGGAPPASGRRVSFRDVHRSSAGRIRGWISSAGVPARDVDDVAQNVFAGVVRRLHTLDPTRPSEPWLKVISLRAARDHLELAFRRHEVPFGLGDAWTTEEADPEEHLTLEELRRLIRDILETLSRPYRAVLVMHHCNDVPMADVAAALGIPLATAYTRLRHARADFEAAWTRRMRRDEHAAARSIATNPCPILGRRFVRP